MSDDLERQCSIEVLRQGRQTFVTIVHLPTGIRVVSEGTDRAQSALKQEALSKLAAVLGRR